MKLLKWIEDIIDMITPRVEVSLLSTKKYTSESFISLMEYISTETDLILREFHDFQYVFNVTGKTVGELSQAQVIFRKKADPKKYENMKSRYECTLVNNEQLRITAFEHFVGLPKERIAFEEVLKFRLESFASFIDNTDIIN